MFYIQLYAVLHGVSPNLAFYLVGRTYNQSANTDRTSCQKIAVLNAASLFGRVLSGVLADRYSPFNGRKLIIQIEKVCSVHFHFV